MDLNTKPKIIKLVAKIWEKCQDQELGKECLDLTPKSWSIKGKKMINCISKIKNLLLCKRTCQGDEKKSYRIEEYICKIYIQQRTYEELPQTQQQNNPIKNWVNCLTGYFTK